MGLCQNLVGGNADKCSDDHLLSTLRTCRLAADRGLDGTLGALSDGQKQLFCVARALVRRPTILVLGEATADLDQESANKLLQVIEENFTDTTVISIAHRLNFIRGSDRVPVLDAGGTVNAFGPPEELLKDSDGCKSNSETTIVAFVRMPRSMRCGGAELLKLVCCLTDFAKQLATRERKYVTR